MSKKLNKKDITILNDVDPKSDAISNNAENKISNQMADKIQHEGTWDSSFKSILDGCKGLIKCVAKTFSKLYQHVSNMLSSNTKDNIVDQYAQTVTSVVQLKKNSDRNPQKPIERSKKIKNTKDNQKGQQ